MQKITLYNPNRKKINGKIAKFRCSTLENAEKLAKFHRENSDVLVASRPKTGGENPKRAVLISIDCCPG